MKTEIKNYNLEELTSYVTALGEKPFRATQLYDWLHVHLARDYDEMTNLSKAFRQKLREETDLTALSIRDCQTSKEDNTKKYLFELGDGHLVESVYMEHSYGTSVCISSQVGCRMGCSFCASTIDGWARNLTAAEMLDQVYSIQRDTKKRISRIVVMGTGEPLDNYENLVRFLHMISDEKGQNISQRNITVSTCGIVPRIYDLAMEGFQITLALSLHAGSQKKREGMMPIAKKYPLSDVLCACDAYFEKMGRRISYEYALIAGENDSAQDAERLIELLRHKNCHLNLIPVNPIAERGYLGTDIQAAKAFQNKLEKNGITTTIRKSMGKDIDGACGQLRRRHLLKEPGTS